MEKGAALLSTCVVALPWEALSSPAGHSFRKVGLLIATGIMRSQSNRGQMVEFNVQMS